jgi:hypothetical protein
MGAGSCTLARGRSPKPGSRLHDLLSGQRLLQGRQCHCRRSAPSAPARGRRQDHCSQVLPTAGPLEVLPDTAPSVLGPDGGLLRTQPAGPRLRRPTSAQQSISQSYPGPLEAPPPAGSGVLGPRIGVVTCFAAARPAVPFPVRGPPTRQAQRHAQDRQSTRTASDQVTRTAA